MKKTLLLAIAPFLLASPVLQGQTTLFSDNFASNSLSSYAINSTGTPGITYSGTAGVNGGGGLSISLTGNPSTSLIPGATGANTGFTIGLGAANTVTMSMMLKKGTTLNGTTQGFLGFSTAQDYNFGSNVFGANTSALGGGIVGGINLVTRGGTNALSAPGGTASSNSGNLVATNTTLTNGNWYLYQVSLTKPTAASNDWIVGALLQDYGTLGTTAGSVAISYTGSTRNFGTTANSGINVDATQTYLNFGIRNEMWTAADNFSVTAVPEPSTWLGAGLLTGLAAWSQRKRLASLARRKATSAN